MQTALLITRPIVFFMFAVTSLDSVTLMESARAQENWPQFRGSGASGTTTQTLPTTWNEVGNENIAWKTRLGGLGHSSPIIWGDKVFLTTAVNANDSDPSLATGWEGANGQAAADEGEWTWKVLCLDRKTGKELWSKNAKKGKPTIKRHIKASHANCTPATDGEFVVAFFGSEGLYCYDFDGKLIWKKDFGRLHSGPYNSDKLEWGFASSPVIYMGTVIIQCDCLNAKFIAILDLKTGKEIRRIERNDVATWSTPTVIEWKGTTQIVCNGFKEMAGYEFESGKQLWTLSGGGDVPVPTPLFHDGLIYISNAHAGNPCYAISPDARGDISPSKEKDAKLPDGLVWYEPRGGSYMPTPIIVNGHHYTCSDRGVLSVRDAKTGDEVYKKRISKRGTNFTASAVASNDHLYFCAENGHIFVVKTGVDFELVATNKLEGIIMSTPSIAGDQLFIRSNKYLYCIQRSSSQTPRD